MKSDEIENPGISGESSNAILRAICLIELTDTESLQLGTFTSPDLTE
jgi:hypothetical protein